MNNAWDYQISEHNPYYFSEPTPGIEPGTSSLPRKCSTPELRRQFRAEDGAQTRDPQLGRLMLYRLSYFRIYQISQSLFAIFRGQ